MASARSRVTHGSAAERYGGVPNTGDGETVNYAYTVAEVIEMMQDAIADGTIEATKNLFDTAHSPGCPLAGTRVDPVL